jgi:ELWxxDGT repeat protein
LLLAAACCALNAAADIVTMPPGLEGSEPADLVAAGEFLYFTADDGICGRELWRLDRDWKASLVADIMPGPESSDPFMLRAAGDVLYFFVRRYGTFSASDQVTLWATRGSTDSTRMLTGPIVQLNPLQAEGIGEDLLFAAAGAGVGRELWHASWAESRYSLFHEFLPGPADGFSPVLVEPWVSSADAVALCAFADVPERPHYVWRCRVTPKEVVPIQTPEGEPLQTGQFLRGAIGDTQAFLITARDGYHIWSASPAFENLTLASGDPLFLEVKQITTVGDHLYFQPYERETGMQLWRSDGKSVELVSEIGPAKEDGAPYFLTPLGQGLVFVAHHSAYGAEPWYSDGTAAGTRLIRDMMPGPTTAAPYQLHSFGDAVLFSCENDSYGEELWRTDGTDEGTWLVKDINEGLADCSPYFLTHFNGQVVFTATSRGAGEEIWVTDGSAEGTRMAAQLRPPLRDVQSSAPADLTAIGHTLYFTAATPELGRELWASDGSEAGTRCIADILPGPAGSRPQQLQAIDEVLYFNALDEAGNRIAQVWNPAIQRLEAQEPPELPPLPTLKGLLPKDCLDKLNLYDPTDWAPLGDDLIFAARDPRHGIELWIYDHDEGTCALLADVFPGPTSSAPTEFIASEGRVCFAAYTLPDGREFWETDGTAAGTRMVRNFLAYPNSGSPTGFVAWNKGVAFLHRNDYGVPMIHYEPTREKESADFLWNFGEALAYPASDPTAAGPILFFVYDQPAYGAELWCVEAGNPRPRLVKDIAPTIVLQP